MSLLRVQSRSAIINSHMKLLRNLFIENTQNVYVQFLRYGFVAAVSLAVDFGVLVVLKEYAQFHYLVAASLSFILGLLTNYSLSKLWVFHSSKLESNHKEFLIFFVIGLIGLLMTDLLMWTFTDLLGVYYVLSKAVATILVYFWNFGARKKILFN